MYLGLSDLSLRANVGSLEGAIQALFANGEQGAWYDPSDFDRYMATGPELITNGDFRASGTTDGWSNHASNAITIDNGRLVSVAGGTNANRVYTVLPLSAGKTYRLRCLLENPAESLTIVRMYINTNTSTGNALGLPGIVNPGESLWIDVTFVARQGDTTLFTSQSEFVGNVHAISNVSVRELPKLSEASLFQDAAGTLPVTALGQPVGLMLDKRFGLARGPELAPAFGDWTDASVGTGTATVVGGVLTITRTDVSNQGKRRLTLPTAVGEWYEVGASFSGTGAPRITVGTTAGGFDVALVIGAGRTIFRAASTTSHIELANNDAGTSTWTAISIRELPGNHSSQPTATARPTLQARVNLLDATDTFRVGTDAWTSHQASWTTATAPDGSPAALVSPAVLGENAFKCYTTPAVGVHTASVKVKAPEGAVGMRAQVSSTIAGTSGMVTFDFFTVSATINGAISAATIEALGGGAFKLTWTFAVTLAGLTSNAYWLRLGKTDDDAGPTLVWDPQLERGPTATTYQRVTSATNYADVGVPRYLQFDGVDDWIGSPTGGQYAAATYALAIAPSSVAATAHAFNSFPGGNTGMGLTVESTGSVSFRVGDGGAITSTAGTVLPFDTARVAVGHYEGSAQSTFTNGVLSGSATRVLVPASSPGIRLGALLATGASAAPGRYYGAIVRDGGGGGITAAQRGVIEYYLASKARITL